MKKLLEAINNGISKALKENNIEFKSVENFDVLDDTDNLTITSKSLNTKPSAMEYIEKKKEERRQEILGLFSEWVSTEIGNWRRYWDEDEEGYYRCKNNLDDAEDYFNGEYDTFLEDYDISDAEDKLLDWDTDLLPIIQSEVENYRFWAKDFFSDIKAKIEWDDDDRDGDDD
jgi:hypothetical protein